MNRLFRKYHRWLALIILLPLSLTVITGMLATVSQEWPVNIGLASNFLLKLHTGEIFGLQAIYPILNGFGIIGLLVTGASMLRLTGRKTPRQLSE
ncbi:MAG: peptidase [Phormidesmis sp.]